MKRWNLLPLAMLPVLLSAQGLMERKHPDIFPLDGKMRRSGFFFAPGITYTLGEKSEYHYGPVDGYGNIWFEPHGRFGPYLEAGWFLATRDPIILDYWDASVAFKQLSGEERSHGEVYNGWTQTLDRWEDGRSTFTDQFLAFSLNANKLLNVADYRFFQFSLGANVDWRLSASREWEGLPYRVGLAEPPDLIAQAHVKVGFGFKLTQRHLLIPAIETPFYSIAPKDVGFGQLTWFNTPYRPLILSVRLMYLRYPKGFDCPKPTRTKRKSKVVNPTFEPKR